MRRTKRDWRFIILYIVLLLAVVVLIIRFSRATEVEEKKIGLITPGSITEDGWQKSSYEALKEDCAQLELKLLAEANVPETGGACLAAIESMVEGGARMIILNSAGYAKEVEGKLEDYPGVAFYGLNFEYETENLISYSARMYQIRYLSGIVAGMQTETDKVGFVAPQRNCETCRGINAFALGVQRVNPDAEVAVAWTEDTAKREKSEEAARKLIEDAGVDVITCWADQPEVIAKAEKAGIQSIGYYETVPNVSEKYLTCASCDWKACYLLLIREYQQGLTGDGSMEWMGVEHGAMHLTEYSSLVSEAAKAEVEKAKEGINAGWNVFSGVIYDNEGKLRCDEGEMFSDETLKWHMDWLIKGVVEYVD